jgi:hypothetical protein
MKYLLVLLALNVHARVNPTKFELKKRESIDETDAAANEGETVAAAKGKDGAGKGKDANGAAAKGKDGGEAKGAAAAKGKDGKGGKVKAGKGAKDGDVAGQGKNTDTLNIASITTASTGLSMTSLICILLFY